MQLIYYRALQYFTHVTRGLIPALIIILFFIVGYLIGRIETNWEWRRDFKQNMPEISRKQIELRDLKILEYDNRITELEGMIDVMSVAIRTSQAMQMKALQSLSIPKVRAKTQLKLARKREGQR